VFRRKMVVLTIVTLLLTVVTACYKQQTEQAPPLKSTAVATGKGKKVVILLVDSLLSSAIDRLVASGQAPALSFLLQNGRYKREMISSFPTMSVNNDSALLSGTYADRHGVPALVWFDEWEKRVVNYGDGAVAVLKSGPKHLIEDSLYNLNHKHLSKTVRTLFEDLHQLGYTSGSINGLVYRGAAVHSLVFPNKLLSTVAGTARYQVTGPDLFTFGALAKAADGPLPDGPFQKYGLNDAYAARTLIRLIAKRALPDMTLAYFPDLDGKLHKNGPDDLTGVVEFDKQLQLILNAFGDWNNALRECVFIVMGDSGVTPIAKDRSKALIDVEQKIHSAGLRTVTAGRQGQKTGDDVAIAVNGRMCYLYALSPRATITEMVQTLAVDRRMDLLAWKEGDRVYVVQGGSGKYLSFRKGGRYVDAYNQEWDLRGDWSVLSLTADRKTGKVTSYTYPDGLARLYSALHSHPGRFLVVTAVPGAEIHADGTPHHFGGGNHGSLHRQDTLFPFVIAGSGRLPAPPDRLIDLKPYLLSLLKK
jgi:predicted AlkP superfamily pyrophosphatase or phosphodiesterase